MRQNWTNIIVPALVTLGHPAIELEVEAGVGCKLSVQPTCTTGVVMAGLQETVLPVRTFEANWLIGICASRERACALLWRTYAGFLAVIT